jgi:hypothetical protein
VVILFNVRPLAIDAASWLLLNFAFSRVMATRAMLAGVVLLFTVFGRVTMSLTLKTPSNRHEIFKRTQDIKFFPLRRVEVVFLSTVKVTLISAYLVVDFVPSVASTLYVPCLTGGEDPFFEHLAAGDF